MSAGKRSVLHTVDELQKKINYIIQKKKYDALNKIKLQQF